MTAARSADHLAALLSYEGPDNGLSPAQSRQDTHAAVGRQVTFVGTGNAKQRDLLAQIIQIADSPHVELVAKRGGSISRRGYLYQGAQQWRSDREGETISQGALLVSADTSHPVTFTLVVAGTGERLGIDRDLDGTLDYAGSNRSPVFGPTGIRVSQRGVAESYQLPATDADGDVLSFSATGLPQGLTLNAQSGLISGIPSQLGESLVVVEVSDGQSGDSVHITWRVLEGLPNQKVVAGGATSLWELCLGVLLCLLLRGSRGAARVRC